ncbi:MAG: hypothetical protein B5M46_02985 [Epsilonproteobacteria bacterium 4484_20]|nr:MAG: hypothetical protein B5M46_02985 [Epsilonproteobacteria bacterium 4484_20]
MNIFDDDDFMASSPKESYFSIAKTANQNIVDMEIEKMFRRLAVAEKMLEEKDLDDELETQIKALVIDEDVDKRLDSIFIELMGNIVTQCE